MTRPCQEIRAVALRDRRPESVGVLEGLEEPSYANVPSSFLRKSNKRVVLTGRAPQTAIAGRWLLIALGTLILCSCRANTFNLHQAMTDNEKRGQLLGNDPQAGPRTPDIVSPKESYPPLVSNTSREPTARAAIAVVDDRYVRPTRHHADPTSGLSSCPVPPNWCPDQPIRRKPHDEYLCDGGDNQTPAHVNHRWEAFGVESEDTLAHFDTLNGQIEIAVSNRVCIYAPRFAAVRKITGFHQNERLVAPSRFQENVGPHRYDDTAIAGQVKQPKSTVREVSTTVVQGMQDRQPGRRIEQVETLLGVQDHVIPLENLAILRTGLFDADEAVVVDQAVQAAMTWTTKQAVQLIIDSKKAFTTKAATNGQVFYTYQMPPGNPRMRVVKLASTRQAQPGEVVEFTLRFDNVGDEPVGNVTILDNLTTRLEYVGGSQTCTREAAFSSEPNDGDSLKLMWDIQQPLETSDGGVIRFKCRVR